ncbi:MAG TPA: hypothetical protein VLA60_02100 [Nitrospirales bacterium]|nr:hypothetical protein [Nitrospirales bacterium]
MFVYFIMPSRRVHLQADDSHPWSNLVGMSYTQPPVTREDLTPALET